MKRTRSKLKIWFSISLTAFLMLVLVNLGLPAPFLLLRVPSFTIGDHNLWILRWQNETTGSEIHEVNPLLILLANSHQVLQNAESEGAKLNFKGA